MKLAITFADSSAAVHIQGETSRTSYIIEITDEDLPAEVIRNLNFAKEPHKHYISASISIVQE